MIGPGELDLSTLSQLVLASQQAGNVATPKVSMGKDLASRLLAAAKQKVLPTAPTAAMDMSSLLPPRADHTNGEKRFIAADWIQALQLEAAAKGSKLDTAAATAAALAAVRHRTPLDRISIDKQPKRSSVAMSSQGRLAFDGAELARRASLAAMAVPQIAPVIEPVPEPVPEPLPAPQPEPSPAPVVTAPPVQQPEPPKEAKKPSAHFNKMLEMLEANKKRSQEAAAVAIDKEQREKEDAVHAAKRVCQTSHYEQPDVVVESVPQVVQQGANEEFLSRVYFGDLPKGTSESLILSECNKHGSVSSIFCDVNPLWGGWAMVTFQTADAAAIAIRRMGRMAVSLWGASERPVEVRFASSDDMARMENSQRESARNRGRQEYNPEMPVIDPRASAMAIETQPAFEEQRGRRSTTDSAGRSDRHDDRKRRRDEERAEREKDRAKKADKDKEKDREKKTDKDREKDKKTDRTDREKEKTDREKEKTHRAERDKKQKPVRAPSSESSSSPENVAFKAPEAKKKKETRGLGGFDSSPVGVMPSIGSNAEAVQLSRNAPSGGGQVGVRGDWAEFATADGRFYYQNLITKEASWARPPGFDRPKHVTPGAGMTAMQIHAGALMPKAMQDLHSNVFVGNFPIGMNEVVFRQLFQPFGTIVSAKVEIEKSYGFVKYSSKAEAQACIDTMNGAIINGVTLAVRMANNYRG